MNSEEFYSAIEKLKICAGNEGMLQEFCDAYKIEDRSTLENLTRLIEGGQKHINAVGKTIEEDGEIDISKISEYSLFVCEFLSKHKFVSPLLIRSYPKDKISEFDNKIWASLMKLEPLKNSTSEQKEIVLKMAINFGVFEGYEASKNRLGNLINILNPQGEKTFDFEEYSGFLHLESQFDPELFRFLKDNIGSISKIDLRQFQENWDSIKKYVDDKTPENINRFLSIAKRHGNDQFKAYMEYHKVPEGNIRKYEVIYNKMQERSRTTTPTVKGKSKDNYEYELLDFTDVRVMRFGNDENIKCCQKLGGNAETSMINSAVEESSRVIIVRDDKGKQIAGSFVTHRISKEGRSYVCFDNIEVKASGLPISIKSFEGLMKKVEKMYKKGKLKGLGIDDVREYMESNVGQKDISKKEMQALEISQKIREAYNASISDMIVKDEEVRKIQLANGEISKEEYDKLLMKNGLFTVGKNWSKIYLKDLQTVAKEEKELLPVPKEKKVYKKAHKFGVEDVGKIEFGLIYALGLGSLIGGNIFTGLGCLGLATLGVAATKKLSPRPNGIYTDAQKEQRILYDGRNASQDTISREEQKELSKKLAYAIEPTRIEDLTPEQKMAIRRIQEISGKEAFSEEDREKIVFGDKNWYSVLSQNDSKLSISDLTMASDIRGNERSITCQKSLVTAMERLKKYAEKRGLDMTFDTASEKINSFCTRHIKAPIQERFETVRENYSRRKSAEIDLSR